MELLITLVLTLFILLGLFSLFFHLKKPVYRLEKSNLIGLFEMVLAGEAAEHDWDVFLEMPIRHDPALEEIRSLCIRLTDEHINTGDFGIRLTETGRLEISSLLERLKRAC